MEVPKEVEKATTQMEPGESCLQAQPVLTELAQLAQSGAPSCSGGCRTPLCLDSAFAEVTDHLIVNKGSASPCFSSSHVFTEPELPSCKLLCPREPLTCPPPSLCTSLSFVISISVNWPKNPIKAEPELLVLVGCVEKTSM